jgi:hypothetical protein
MLNPWSSLMTSLDDAQVPFRPTPARRSTLSMMLGQRMRGTQPYVLERVKTFEETDLQID